VNIGGAMSEFCRFGDCLRSKVRDFEDFEVCHHGGFEV
jgi:hypothetical protein